jgi:hypothetical protein
VCFVPEFGCLTDTTVTVGRCLCAFFVRRFETGTNQGPKGRRRYSVSRLGEQISPTEAEALKKVRKQNEAALKVQRQAKQDIMWIGKRRGR